MICHNRYNSNNRNMLRCSRLLLLFFCQQKSRKSLASISALWCFLLLSHERYFSLIKAWVSLLYSFLQATCLALLKVNELPTFSRSGSFTYLTDEQPQTTYSALCFTPELSNNFNSKILWLVFSTPVTVCCFKKLIVTLFRSLFCLKQAHGSAES